MCVLKTKQIITILIILKCAITLCLPLDQLLSDLLTQQDDGTDEFGDYDLHYDQRQNGTENYRISLNGVIVAIPTGAASQATELADLGALFAKPDQNFEELFNSSNEDKKGVIPIQIGGGAKMKVKSIKVRTNNLMKNDPTNSSVV